VLPSSSVRQQSEVGSGLSRLRSIVLRSRDASSRSWGFNLKWTSRIMNFMLDIYYLVRICWVGAFVYNCAQSIFAPRACATKGGHTIVHLLVLVDKLFESRLSSKCPAKQLSLPPRAASALLGKQLLLPGFQGPARVAVVASAVLRYGLMQLVSALLRE